jgi:ABC-2 type transport system ATP-binding protein
MNEASDTSAALAAENVSVSYDGRVVLDAVTLNVARGSVYALLGRNGAGKSSLIRCSLGLQKPLAGTVRIFGEDSWTGRARVLTRAAYVPETSDAPASLRVGDVIAFHRASYARWDDAALDRRLSRAGIDRSVATGSLSKGQRSLFSLGLALASRPELLVLDDPTLGLDVVARNEFFSEIVGDLADRETTVFLTTHDLSGVESIADRVGILRGAKLVLDRSVEELKGERGQSLEEIFTEVTRAA